MLTFLLTATAMQGRPMTGNRGSALGIQTPVPQVCFSAAVFNDQEASWIFLSKILSLI